MINYKTHILRTIEILQKELDEMNDQKTQDKDFGGITNTLLRYQHLDESIHSLNWLLGERK